jgi:hypothetical protein
MLKSWHRFFDMHDLLACLSTHGAAALMGLPVGQAKNASKFDVFWPVHPSTGLYQLLETFTRGVHRCPVTEDGRVVGVVSQSDVMAFLAQRVSAADGQKFTAKLANLGIIRTKPLHLAVWRGGGRCC